MIQDVVAAENEDIFIIGRLPGGVFDAYDTQTVRSNAFLHYAFIRNLKYNLPKTSNRKDIRH